MTPPRAKAIFRNSSVFRRELVVPVTKCMVKCTQELENMNGILYNTVSINDGLWNADWV